MKDWRTFCLVTAAIAVVWSVLLLVWPSNAAESAPYGDCKETMQVLTNPAMLDSDGVRYCRRHGWIVREHVVVSPFGQATTDLPRCTMEDSTRCYWNALRRGNHEGEGYVALVGRMIRVDWINGHRAGEHLFGYYSIVPYHT